jgi:N-acetyl-anhydromuramyl-L-alanine amidase AmpD
MDTTPITPPFASKARTKPVTTVVMHSTAGTTLAGAVSTLRAKGLGYHYLIERDGTVHKGCATSRNCGHAGESVGPDGRHCNSYAIGVSFVHPNDGTPIDQRAIDAAGELLKALADAIPSLEWLCTHWAITVKPNGSARKTDPRGCPLSALASQAGLKPWKPSYATRYSL